MSRQTAYVADTQPIRAEDIYSMDAFIRASGITRQRIREARQKGIEPNIRHVGKRQFILGRDGIAFILAMADAGADE